MFFFKLCCVMLLRYVVKIGLPDPRNLSKIDSNSNFTISKVYIPLNFSPCNFHMNFICFDAHY